MNDDVPHFKNALNMQNKYSTLDQLQRGGSKNPMMDQYKKYY